MDAGRNVLPIGQWRAVDVPWAAWYADSVRTLLLPAAWQIDVLHPRGAEPWTAGQIAGAFEKPVETPRLSELAQGRRNACIAVDDLTRPTKIAEILPHVLVELKKGGIPPEATTVLVAAGSHGRLEDERLLLKFGGELPEVAAVQCHDPKGPLGATGIRLGQFEMAVNRTWIRADLKVGIGSVLPHALAGYSGGAKIVVPGLVDLATVARCHKFAAMTGIRGTDPHTTLFRAEAERLAPQVGLDFVVCTVCGNRRDPCGVVVGHPQSAHRAACRLAEQAYATTCQRSYDCLLLNAYPKDTNLIQSLSCLVALRQIGASMVNDDGVIVITTASPEGVGEHGLYGPHRTGQHISQPAFFTGNREIWIYGSGIGEKDASQVLWPSCRFFDDAVELASALEARFPDRTAAAVLPSAPIQQLKKTATQENG